MPKPFFLLGGGGGGVFPLGYHRRPVWPTVSGCGTLSQVVASVDLTARLSLGDTSGTS